MFAWNKGARRGTMASHDQNGEAMSTEDFIRESFAEARREQVPNGHELFEHLKDEPLSDEDAVGVTFGNRQTLQRLYDDGKVKPEGDAAFREALGLPPRSQDPQAGARLLAAHASAPAQDSPGQPPAPAEQPGFLPRVAQGAGQAFSRTWEELTTNKNLHRGVEAGGRATWEATKWTAEEAAKQVRDNIARTAKDAASLFISNNPNAMVMDGRSGRIDEAYRRAMELEADVKKLAERMKQARDKAYSH